MVDASVVSLPASRWKSSPRNDRTRWRSRRASFGIAADVAKQRSVHLVASKAGEVDANEAAEVVAVGVAMKIAPPASSRTSPLLRLKSPTARTEASLSVLRRMPPPSAEASSFPAQNWASSLLPKQLSMTRILSTTTRRACTAAAQEIDACARAARAQKSGQF